ncbi:MAG: hypothetical protein WCF81_07705 [Roseiarcus sp.]
MTKSELDGRMALFCRPLLLVAAMSALSLRQRCVDGRHKAGQDDTRLIPKSTANALRAGNILQKVRNSAKLAHDSPAPSHYKSGGSSLFGANAEDKARRNIFQRKSRVTH